MLGLQRANSEVYVVLNIVVIDDFFLVNSCIVLAVAPQGEADQICAFKWSRWPDFLRFTTVHLDTNRVKGLAKCQRA